MIFFKSLTIRLCLFSLLYSTTLAAPVEIGVVKRARGDQNDPIDVWFDINGWEDIAEQNAYIYLYIRRSRILQRVQTRDEAGQNYVDSGAKQKPFQNGKWQKFGTTPINTDTVSGEECPWKSTTAGGDSSYVCPATIDQQTKQGNRLKTGYRTYGADLGFWFRVNFYNSAGTPLGPYASALNADDYSICNQQVTQTLFGSAGVILANYVYMWIRNSGQWGRVKPPGSKRSDGFEMLFNKTYVDGISF